MEKISFHPVDFTYKLEGDKAIIYMYGRSRNEKICVSYDHFMPYLLIKPVNGKTEETIKLLENRVFRLKERNITIKNIEKTERIEVTEKLELLKIYTEYPSDLPLLHNELKDFGQIEKQFEFDIKFIKRFLIDNNITPLQEYEITGEFIPSNLKTKLFLADKIAPKSDEIPSLNILAFDIETYPVANEPSKYPIMMISLYNEKYKKVLTWKKSKFSSFVEVLPDEREMLLRFCQITDELKPDILCGYFSDGFDMPFIRERAQILGVELNISENKTGIRMKKGVNKVASIEGICHIDVYKFIKQIWGESLQTHFFDLNSIAEEILGEQKKDLDFVTIKKLWDEGKKLNEIAEYNLQDSILAYKLCNEILPQIIELVKLTKLPAFDVSRARYSNLVEGYLMHSAVEEKMIIPKKPSFNTLKERKKETFKGAFVIEPKPGFFRNVAIFDFSSLYPTIITAFNISPETLNCRCCSHNGHKVPDKEFWYCKKNEGFISKAMRELVIRRQRIKEILKGKEQSVYLNARSYAMKTVANAMYGYLGFFAARWYCNECADSITAFGRYYINNVIQKAKEKEFNVIYGDTDSIFIELKDKDMKKSLDLVREINDELPDLMELTFQGLYPRGIFVELKQSTSGAKKKYALIDEKGKIIIKGFETVRRNWSELAKETQRRVIEIILKDNDIEKALSYVREIINDIREGKIEKEKIIIKTQLQKTISSYESIGPHVSVAKKLKAKGREINVGDTIEYIIGKGLGTIGERAIAVEDSANTEYDADYYIMNQILPGVLSLFKVLGLKEDDILSHKNQKTLSKFF